MADRIHCGDNACGSGSQRIGINIVDRWECGYRSCGSCSGLIQNFHVNQRDTGYDHHVDISKIKVTS